MLKAISEYQNIRILEYQNEKRTLKNIVRPKWYCAKTILILKILIFKIPFS